MTILFPNTQIKNQISALKCPSCKCGLEGSPVRNQYTRNQYTAPLIENCQLRCSYYPSHYSLDLLWVSPDGIAIFTDREIYGFLADNFWITITKYYDNNTLKTVQISNYECDGNGFMLNYIASNSIKLDFDPFDFTNFDEKKIREKVKLIYTFQ